VVAPSLEAPEDGHRVAAGIPEGLERTPETKHDEQETSNILAFDPSHEHHAEQNEFVDDGKDEEHGAPCVDIGEGKIPVEQDLLGDATQHDKGNPIRFDGDEEKEEPSLQSQIPQVESNSNSNTPQDSSLGDSTRTDLGPPPDEVHAEAPGISREKDTVAGEGGGTTAAAPLIDNALFLEEQDFPGTFESDHSLSEVKEEEERDVARVAEPMGSGSLVQESMTLPEEVVEDDPSMLSKEEDSDDDVGPGDEPSVDAHTFFPIEREENVVVKIADKGDGQSPLATPVQEGPNLKERLAAQVEAMQSQWSGAVAGVLEAADAHGRRAKELISLWGGPFTIMARENSGTVTSAFVVVAATMAAFFIGKATAARRATTDGCREREGGASPLGDFARAAAELVTPRGLIQRRSRAALEEDASGTAYKSARSGSIFATMFSSGGDGGQKDAVEPVEQVSQARGVQGRRRGGRQSAPGRLATRILDRLVDEDEMEMPAAGGGGVRGRRAAVQDGDTIVRGRSRSRGPAAKTGRKSAKKSTSVVADLAVDDDEMPTTGRTTRTTRKAPASRRSTKTSG